MRHRWVESCHEEEGVKGVSMGLSSWRPWWGKEGTVESFVVVVMINGNGVGAEAGTGVGNGTAS
jgi:hypothetical protein